MEKKHYQTGGRTRLLAYLKEHASRAPHSAEQIYGGLCALGDAPAQSSVYRMLATLSAEGEVRKYPAEGGFLYQYVGQGRTCDLHFHLQCLVCGEVTHLECGCGREIASHLSRTHGFAVDCGKTLIYGRCAKCAVQGGEV